MRRARRDSLKRFNPNYGENKQMNSEVYALRRKVINIIYKMNDQVQGKLPRVQVRVTDQGTGDCSRVLGTATMGNKEIWIAEEAFKYDDKRLYHVVLHELCHALFSTDHSNSCHLMSPAIPRYLDNSKALKAFKGYAKQAGYKLA
jgi:predicted metal-dependent hydrolase